MPKWDCNGTVVGGKYLGHVEAETKEEAQEKAWDLLDCSVGLCYQCGRNLSDLTVESIEVYERGESDDEEDEEEEEDL